MMIRNIEVNDAEEFLKFTKLLDEETKFMLYEPNERAVTVEEQTQSFMRIKKAKDTIFFIAIEGERIIGFVAGIGSSIKRINHSLSIAIGILTDYQGKGIGTKLLNRVEAWAREHNKQRLELTVMVHNELAVKLYTKQGFIIEGTKKHSIKIDNTLIDEYYMAKLL